MNVQFDIAGFRAQLHKTAEKINAATRPAAQAGAQVIYDAARVLAPQSQKRHYFYIRKKKYGPYAPGNLRDSIYQAFSKDRSGPSKATYHVSWNRDKAPYGHMVELGTSRAPAHSFIGAAVHDFGREALEAMRVTFIRKVTQ